MAIYRHSPAPPLNQYVELFWYYVDLFPDHDREHVLPDGTFELLEVKEGKFITHEDVKGNANGVTEVRATSELLPDGKFHVRARVFEEWKLDTGA